jgi:GxxExxY protein
MLKSYDNHGVTEAQSTMGLVEEELTKQIIAAAIEVHQHLGPGLLESVYEECLCCELSIRNIPFERQKPLPIEYKGVKIECSYRMDVVVDGKVVVEIKCADLIAPVHEAQVLTYLKLSNVKVGLILNFYSAVLKTGIKRLVL